MLDIQKLKFKDVGFIIDGVEFSNKESATDFLIVHFSKKIIEILTIYNKMCKVKESMIQSDVASVNLNVQIEEKLLMPEWYANKPLFNFFSKEILEKLNIEYKADEGGNYSGAYFYLIPGNVVDIPTFDKIKDDLLEFESLSKYKIL